MCCYLLDVFYSQSLFCGLSSRQTFGSLDRGGGKLQANMGSGCRDCMAKGTVKWFNEKKGFGFIVDPDVPTDIFVHFSVIQADGFKTLNEGETVEYELYQDEKGAKARNVLRA